MSNRNLILPTSQILYTEIHAPGPQLHYDPRYYAAQVRDPDGYSLEFVYKSWQHPA